jgi:S1-C subfamily serine protease
MVTGFRGCFPAILWVFAATQGFGQVKTELVNSQGATAPCIGIGPVGGPAAKKCAALFEMAGFLVSGQVGYSGLTVGTAGSSDGTVTKIDAQSPAASAGFQVGDIITAVNGKAAELTPGMVAAKLVFGQRDDTLNLTLKRAGSPVNVSLVRGPQTAPKGPTVSGFMTEVKEMINWENEFVPCIGIGPAAPVAISYCYGHFKPFGYIKAAELGSTGFDIDLANASKALITAVAPDSSAAKAGVLPGDEIVAVGGMPLAASRGEEVSELLFAKSGDRLQVKVQRGQADRTFELVLASTGK